MSKEPISSANRLRDRIATVYPDEDPKEVMRRLYCKMGSYRAVADMFGVGRTTACVYGNMCGIYKKREMPERYRPIVRWIKGSGKLEDLYKQLGTWEAVAFAVGVTPRVMKSYRIYTRTMKKRREVIRRGDWKRRITL